MRRARQLGAALLFLTIVGCGVKRIPGTDLDDSRDNRKILEVMEKYRTAVEARDPDGVLAVVDPAFRDVAGTLDPSDDLTAANLRARLADRFKRIQDVRVQVEVKRIEVEPNVARAIYTYVMQFRIAPNGKPQVESDIKRMEFKRAGDGWRILTGI